MTDLSTLQNRMSKKVQNARGMQLTAEELDLIVTCGAYQAICNAAIRQQEEQCRLRSAKSRSINGGNSGSIKTAAAAISKSSGMMTSGNESDELARARAMLPRPRQNLTAATLNPKAKPAAQPASGPSMMQEASS
jgi:hypothetical protein